jgi:hypothetical protein
MISTASHPRYRTLFLLLAATAISVAVSHDGAIGRLAGAGTLALAWFKGRLVLLDFMELRHAPLRWRLGFEGGLLIVTAVLIVMDVTATGRP